VFDFTLPIIMTVYSTTGMAHLRGGLGQVGLSSH